MSNYLPDWLLPEILCRLPIESLLRFRCVSKQLCSLISSPDFISTYGSITNNALFVLSHFSKKHQNYSVYFDPCSETQNLALFKEFKKRSRNQFRVLGLCNGLFCLTDDFFRYSRHALIILWNPSIRKSISLPNPAVCSAPYVPHRFCIGFGFDHKNHDFKVVKIDYLERVNGVYMVPLRVEVYKLSIGQWKIVNNYSKGFFNCKLYIEDCSIYVNGAIHWLFYGKKNNEGREITNSLLVFDPSDETFSEMDLPRVVATHVSYLDLSVTLCGEKISVILYEDGRYHGPSCCSCVVWVMNEYGNTESWMQKFVVNLNGISDAIGFTRNGEFLVVQYPGNLLSYNPGKRELKELNIHGRRRDSFFLTKYVESLVLLDRNN